MTSYIKRIQFFSAIGFNSTALQLWPMGFHCGSMPRQIRGTPWSVCTATYQLSWATHISGAKFKGWYSGPMSLVLYVPTAWRQKLS